MTGTELEAELAAGRIRSAYLLAGTEPLLRDDALAAIEKAVLASAPRDFNLDRLDVAKSTPGRLEEALASLPVLAERRLVGLREAESRGGKLDEGWCRAGQGDRRLNHGRKRPSRIHVYKQWSLQPGAGCDSRSVGGWRR